MSLGNLGITVSVRTNSRRLPAKALLPIGGKPSCLFLLDRLRESLMYPLYVATTTHYTDNILAGILRQHNYNVFRGDEKNVFNRLLALANTFELDSVVRITADCPMLDGKFVNQLLQSATEFMDWDLITTKGVGIPGLDIEVIRRSSMLALVDKLNEYDQEHVTSFIYRNSADFRIRYVGSKRIFSTQESFLLDTIDDFIKINNFVDKHGVDFTFKL